VAAVAATGKQVAQMVDLELLLFVIPFQRVLRSLLHLVPTLLPPLVPSGFAHGLSHQQFLLFNTSLLPVVAVVAVTQLVVAAPADYLLITAEQP